MLVPPVELTASSIAVSPSLSSFKVGQAVQVTAVVKNPGGQVLPDVVVTWTSDNLARATVSETGVVIGITEGVVTITATSGSTTGSTQVTVTAAAAPIPVPATTWTFCTAFGAACDFIGLRDVRLGAANGPYVQQTAYHTVPCATYAFNDQNPAPNQPLHCDYGPIKSTTLVNPQPGMGGLGATVVAPLGAVGGSGKQTAATSEVPVYTDGSGSFRTTCSLATFAFDDPIVYPGQPGASHLHAFFGNTAINAGSSPLSVASSGNSTCRGGTLNRTGYWVPAMIDTRTGSVVVPDEAVFYYKTGYNVDPKVVQAPPVGLRMIAGNKLATGAQDNVSWSCRDHYQGDVASIPTCPVGDAVRLAVIFPQCWDGKNLDAPDHKSHMAYPVYRNPPQVSSCPATHPITIPVITEHFDFSVTDAAAIAFWRLSSDMYSASLPGGYSGHADWMNGWDPETLNTIVTQCLNKAVDCGVGSIGNGTTLY